MVLSSCFVCFLSRFEAQIVPVLKAPDPHSDFCSLDIYIYTDNGNSNFLIRILGVSRPYAAQRPPKIGPPNWEDLSSNLASKHCFRHTRRLIVSSHHVFTTTFTCTIKHNTLNFVHDNELNTHLPTKNETLLNYTNYRCVTLSNILICQ